MTLSPLVLGWTLMITTFLPDDTIVRQKVENLSQAECEGKALAAVENFNAGSEPPVAIVLCRPPPDYVHADL
jgi:hypothetical protein